MHRLVADPRSTLYWYPPAVVPAVAQVVHEALEQPRNIHFKGVTDLVTDTDRASEEAILKASHATRLFLHDTGD